MKSILVPIEDCASLNAQLSAAVLVARQFAGHVDGVAPFKALNAYAVADGGVGISTVMLESFEQDQRDRIDKAQKIFRTFMRDRKISWGSPLKPANRPTADWLEERDGGDQAIGQLARLYDVTVMARQISGTSLPRGDLLETVLFESGRPILIVPPNAPTSLGKTIVIAWNGSTESARAITFSEPFLRQAERVFVLTIEGGAVAGPDARDVERSLLRAGISAEARDVQPADRSIGEAILAQADQLGADLLVKGAYTHSRLRQMVFGGATNHILAEANLPVLMVH